MLEWPLMVQLFRTQLKLRRGSRAQDKGVSAHRLRSRTWWLSDNETGARGFFRHQETAKSRALGRVVHHI